ncbi:molybdopterin cofactor-binding domain-containing protein (plasmid) [Pseudoalteromonas espejiana]
MLSLKSGDYWARKEPIKAFNASSPIIKRGLAMTPVKYGISFYHATPNQAGALVHVYSDGSIHLNHGGTEMGQGLNTKMAHCLAHGFGVDFASAISIARPVPTKYQTPRQPPHQAVPT